MDTRASECERERLQLLLVGQLSESEHIVATRHLESCQTCQRDLERIEVARTGGTRRVTFCVLVPMILVLTNGRAVR